MRNFFLEYIIDCGNDDIDCEGVPAGLVRKCGSTLQNSFVTIYDTNPELLAEAYKMDPTRPYYLWISGVLAHPNVDFVLEKPRVS